MPQYVLMFYDRPEEVDQFMSMSPEEIQAVIEKYNAWGEGLAAQGKLVMGEKLRDGSGRVLRRGAVTDGPFSEAREVIGGITIIDAADYEEAVALCRDHPHMEFGGALEIREIEPTPGPEQDAPTAT